MEVEIEEGMELDALSLAIAKVGVRRSYPHHAAMPTTVLAFNNDLQALLARRDFGVGLAPPAGRNSSTTLAWPKQSSGATCQSVVASHCNSAFAARAYVRGR